jgi:type VI secretion system lysozyme-like protein
LIDVEKLLNTRTRCASSPEHLRELGVSLVDYGLRDFATRDLASDVDRARLVEEIRSVVTRYEPRLCDIDVEMLPRGEEFEQAVRFRITASVRQGAELIVWDADYAPSKGKFVVREETA